MKLKPIINSLCETDQYKMNMMDVVMRKFNDYTVVWTFKCRNEDVRFTPEMIKEIREQVDHYCTLRFTDDELEWLKKNLPWLSTGFINHLKFWHPVRNEIWINENNIQSYNDCGLAIEAHGTWLNTSFYEIALLAIVNEVYFAFKYGVGSKDIEFQKRTIEKFGKLGIEYDIGNFAEFGLRRRLSGEMQDWLIKYCAEQKVPGFVGTSNVFLAKKYGCKCVGTMAHEMGMAMMSDLQYNPAYINKRIMEVWTECFGVKNGTVLTDVVGRDAFLADFDERFATLFSGVRHDSGNPLEWGDAIIKHYEKLGIDPKTKMLLFSDALDFEKATKIKKYFDGRCKVSFGIGTYLAGIQDKTPLNIVMKVTEANGIPVCKLTDNPEKAMGKDKNFIDFVRRSIDWRITHNK